MSLLELSVVICVILSMMFILWVGARAWKKGSDRAGCVMNIRNMQMAVRGCQNMGGYDQGQPLNAYEESQDILELVNLKGFISADLYQISIGGKECPGGGTCSCTATTHFPAVGDLFMECSLKTEETHQPEKFSEW